MTQDRTRLRELFDELHSVGKQCDDPNLRTLIVGAATVLIAQDDERAALQAERDALAALLRETLQPGAYGIGSTLAQRISDALNGAKGAT